MKFHVILVLAIFVVSDAQIRNQRPPTATDQEPSGIRNLPEAGIVIGLLDGGSSNRAPRPTVTVSHGTNTEDVNKRDVPFQPNPSTTASTTSEQMPPEPVSNNEPFSRQVPLCILVDVVDDPYNDRMRTAMKYGKTFIPRVG